MPRKGHVVKRDVLPVYRFNFNFRCLSKKAVACILSSIILICSTRMTWAEQVDFNGANITYVNNCKLVENQNERIASEVKDGKLYVSIFNKSSNVLTQNVYDEKTNLLLKTFTCDLNNVPVSNACTNTIAGFGYLDTKSKDGIIICSHDRRGNQKPYIDGISSAETLNRVYDFENAVENIRHMELITAAGLIGVLVCGLFNGGYVVELTDSMLAALGISSSSFGICYEYYRLLREAERKYDLI